MSLPKPELTDWQARLVLNALPEMGPITLRRLLEALGNDPVAVLRATPEQLAGVPRLTVPVRAVLTAWPQHFDLAREETRLAQAAARFITTEDSAYPPLLRTIHDPPIGLYRRGPDEGQGTAVAIVGSRRTTHYGQSVAHRLAADLAGAGCLIVSGLARGIDTAAHEGALAVDGRTVAVLGHGLDQVYPPENYDLYRRIAARGALLAEFPFGRPADRQSFAMRNRIVSGMCAATIVVESDVDGGAMITARFAGEQGRVVGAVPGRVDQPTSRGCHQLLRDGALLVTGAEDVWRELQYLGRAGALGLPGGAAADPRPPLAAPTALPGAETGELALGTTEQTILATFAGGELLTLDAVAERVALPVSSTAATLLALELQGRLVKRTDGRYEARSG